MCSDKNANAVSTDNWPEVCARAEALLSKPVVRFIEQSLKTPEPESQLIAVLHKVQEQFGHLSNTHLDAVAQLMQIPAAKVSGVATFYHFFRLNPKGRYVINLCMGTACYVKGADRVAQRIKDELGIDFGETTKDGIFSLEASRCLGTCGLAPILMVGEDVHAQVTPDKVPAILEKYLQSQVAS